MSAGKEQQGAGFDPTVNLTHGVLISVGSEEAIRACLIDGEVPFRQTWEQGVKDIIDPVHPLGQWSTLTTRDDPAVIFDDRAAFCSPIITFDVEGNALHFHDTLFTQAKEGYGPNAAAYFAALPRHITGIDVTYCIAGLNFGPSISDLDQEIHPFDQVVDYVDRKMRSVFPSIRGISFVPKHYRNQRRTSEIVPPNTDSNGFVFVPAYLAKDRANHLFTVTNHNGAHLKQAFGIPKKN